MRRSRLSTSSRYLTGRSGDYGYLIKREMKEHPQLKKKEAALIVAQHKKEERKKALAFQKRINWKAIREYEDEELLKSVRNE